MVCFASPLSSMWCIRSVHAFFFVESIQSHQSWRCCIIWYGRIVLGLQNKHCQLIVIIAPSETNFLHSLLDVQELCSASVLFLGMAFPPVIQNPNVNMNYDPDPDPSNSLPGVVRFVSEPTLAQLGLHLTQIRPGFIDVEPRMDQGLFHRVSLPALDLKSNDPTSKSDPLIWTRIILDLPARDFQWGRWLDCQSLSKDGADTWRLHFGSAR